MAIQQRLDLQFPSQRNEAIHEGAKAYAKSQGRTYSAEGLDQLQVDSARGYRQQQSYTENQGKPASPHMRRSYEALRTEIGQQFDFMTKPKEHGGLGIRVEVPDQYPYASHQDMLKDVAGGRIQVQSSRSTGSTHEVFSQEENDRFRAVHDVFGHAAIGRGFSRHGEEAAYQSHAQMFSPEARPALASETRGQNSVLNFTPGKAQFIDEQRMVDVPDWAVGNKSVPPAQRQRKIKPAGSTQMPLF
jgi:hypothetical protein